MFKIGIIGLGARIHEGVLPAFFEVSNEISVTAVTDTDYASVKKRIEEKPEFYSDNLNMYKDADDMLDSEQLDGVIVGTRCSLHTDMAIKVMKKGLPLFLEKPVATTLDDIERLRQADATYKSKTIVSFPLRYTEIAVKVKQLIDAGEIGDVIQVDAFNDVPYGRIYFHDWYRNEEETGGLWLQKATHDFDCINYILGDRATEIFAMESKSIFKGNKPAGLKCCDCPENKTCQEGPYVIKNIYHDNVIGEYCCFAEDTGNHDCGNAIVKYSNGTVVNYSQNFFTRHKALRRGARFYGYKGTLEFDWYKNEINIYRHDSPRVDTVKYTKSGASHFGGDNRLAQLFVGVLKGETDYSYLGEGIQSALMCLMAKSSCQCGQKVDIPE